MRKPNSKDFESYPSHTIRLSDETWDELKKQKDKLGKNWESFIKSLINKNNE